MQNTGNCWPYNLLFTQGKVLEVLRLSKQTINQIHLMKTSKINFLLVLTILLAACGPQQKKEKAQNEDMVEPEAKELGYDTNDPSTILAAIEQAHGGWNDLWTKKDVEFTYNYHYTDNGRADISTERYIFASEASYGHYTRHEINVMPDAEGEVQQLFDGENTKMWLNGKEVTDPTALAAADFLRRANYFWFVMPYKLNDPGTIVSYDGQETYNGKTYDKVTVTYYSSVTGKEENDIYVLYVNPETKLVDRFYFSLPFMGVNEPVIIADYEYSDVNGQKLATKRRYYMPSEQGYSDTPNLVQTMADIKFNNGFTLKNLSAR